MRYATPDSAPLGGLFRLALALLCAGAMTPSVAAGQAVPPEVRIPDDPDAVQVVTLRDGSVLNGRVLDPGPPVRFRLSSGSIVELDPATIREIRVTEGRVVEGELWEPDPNPSRLFFAPTGRTTAAGTGYIGVFELILPFISFSPTDALMIAGGTPLIGGFDRRPFYIAPKLRVVRTDRVQASVGVWSIGIGDADADVFSLLYGVATVGSLDRALTVGLGYGVEGSDFVDRPVLVLGGEVRVSRRAKLVTENWVFPEGGALISLGPRFMASRLTADLGVGLFLEDGGGGPVLIPLINFVYAF